MMSLQAEAISKGFAPPGSHAAGAHPGAAQMAGNGGGGGGGGSLGGTPTHGSGGAPLAALHGLQPWAEAHTA